MSCINIKSEIGKLTSVLVHRPGSETQNYLADEFPQVFTLRPWSTSFDTVKAQMEHDRFTDALKREGVECLYLEDLLQDALEADPAARSYLIDAYLDECGATGNELQDALYELVASVPTRSLIRLVLDGIRMGQVLPPMPSRSSLASATGEAFDPNTFLANPLNTTFFTRDPVTAVGDGILLNHMYWPERNREVPLYKTVFTYHPDFCDAPQWFSHTSSYHIEGGDVLNLNESSVLIGISQRTEAAAIDTLAKTLLWTGGDSSITAVYAVEVPSTGTRLHLDTFLNRIDYDTFLVDPHIVDACRMYRITKGRRRDTLSVQTLDCDLQEMLSQALDISPIRCIVCGAEHGSTQERELENNSCAVLALSPGRLCVFEENKQTNSLLETAGMDLIALRADELTAGYGGVNCLCLPLWREDLA